MKSALKHKIREGKGFTLLEVMVAITILLLVILPLASLYVRSLTVIQNAALYSQAIQLAQERMELCEALDYGNLYYYNEIYTPGFPYIDDPLPPRYIFNGEGVRMDPLIGNNYDNRDNPDTDDIEYNYDPTDSEDENVPVPIYRDYYNNYTGLLLDPNFNGLCDDDLDGDGDSGILVNPFDFEDIEIATNGTLRMYSDTEFDDTPAQDLGDTYVPGDGLYDTVVEGIYVSSLDPMYRLVRIQESPTPILDMGLLLDRQHRIPTGSVPDYRHREVTFQGFVRMTTFIDPTPTLGNPNDVTTFVDSLYFRDRREIDGYEDYEIYKLRLCLRRDLPLADSYSSFDVGIDDAGLIELDPFNVNYTVPIYGMRIIVTVFYLTGEGEMQLTDIDNDGVLDEVPMETYGGARRIRLERTFYSDLILDASSKEYMPPRRFVLSTAGNADNPARAITITDVEGVGEESDPCSFENKGLPYLD